MLGKKRLNAAAERMAALAPSRRRGYGGETTPTRPSHSYGRKLARCLKSCAIESNDRDRNRARQHDGNSVHEMRETLRAMVVAHHTRSKGVSTRTPPRARKSQRIAAMMTKATRAECLPNLSRRALQREQRRQDQERTYTLGSEGAASSVIKRQKVNAGRA